MGYSITLNSAYGLWQFVVISPDGGFLQTSHHVHESPEIAASHARLWIEAQRRKK